MLYRLRPATPADVPFERALYAATRQVEMAPTGWPQDAIDAFLASQFDLQSAHYAQHYADAVHEIVEQDGVAVGRRIVLDRPDEVRLVDVALVDAVRGRGLGTRLVQDVIARAGARPVVLHVEVFNPALRLYERLGFRATEQVGAYWRMETAPAEAPAASPDASG